MILINLNHHVVTIRNSEGNIVKLPSAKPALRLQSKRTDELLPCLGGILLVGFTTEPAELPEPVEGTLYVVNEKVALYAARQGREDFVYPVTTGRGTGKHLPVRGADGKLLHVCALQRVEV